MHSLYQWARRHPTYVDAGLALLLFALGPLVAPWSVAHAVTGLLVCAPLVVRRRYPLLVLGWCYVVGLVQLLAGIRVTMPDLALVIALYTVACRGPRWAVGVAVAGGVAGGAAAALVWSRHSDAMSVLAAVALLVAPVLLAWAMGDNMRVRRAYLAGLEERAARLERERDARARAAAAQERSRIARELHDVVAHSVSVIVLQADGADAALKDADLGEVEEAIGAIGRVGRQALAELRLLLGVLRDGAAGTEPQPDEARLGDLISGTPLPVRLTTDGRPRPLPPGVGLVAYRIVQEALTNIIKHAGVVTSVQVRLGYAADELRLDIDDDGNGPCLGAGLRGEDGGHGLVGMRERVSLFGGTLTAGARPGGGFRVRAHIPLGAEGSR